ncbi:MAG: DUF1015 domain-containing protein [bacterium]|jgi:uncharacterized protein (DUF1015 family)
MAKIEPFRATRFSTELVGNLSDVVALPYDKITPAMQDAYYAKSEFNICRISKGIPQTGDSEGNDVYSRAAETWKRWLESGVLREDDRPALYVYHQIFQVGGTEFTRRGLCCMVELQDYGTGGVKPHERTLDAPKQDRFKLLMALDAHLGQIFQLYPDPDNEVASLLAEACISEPEMEATIEEDGQVVHRVWAITHPDTISTIQNLLLGKQLFIADGHHRYETALNYRNARMAEYIGGPDGHNPRFAMMTLVGMSDPGLVVLPTHRVLFNLAHFNPGDFISQIRQYFAIAEMRSLDELAAEMKSRSDKLGRNAFGFYMGGRFYLCELSDHDIMRRLAPERSEAWRSLDVAVLHEVVLEHLLGISKEAQAAKTNISYDRSAISALAKVNSGTHQLAVLMNPTKLSQIREVAGNGEVMPQKSTDFYPKLITGLLACKVNLGAKRQAAAS